MKNEVLQAQKENKRIIPCFHRNVLLRYIDYAKDAWGLEKIQGIEFGDKYDLTRELYLKIEQIEMQGKKADKNHFIPLSRKSQDWNLKKADEFKKLGLNTNAIEIYDNEIRSNPNDSSVWFNKGYCLEKEGRYIEAIESFDEAIRIKPDYAEAWYNKGKVLVLLRRYVEAVKVFETLIKIKPDYAEAWYNKGVS